MRSRNNVRTVSANDVLITSFAHNVTPRVTIGVRRVGLVSMSGTGRILTKIESCRAGEMSRGLTRPCQPKPGKAP